MRVDSHQHFWMLSRGDYGWLTPEAGTIYRDFQPDDLRPMLSDMGIHRTIAVQAAPTVEETQYLLSIAREEAFIAGVVGWVDMDRPGWALKHLDQLSQEPKLRGIRPMIQDMDDTGWMLGPAPAPVFERLIDFGLRFDALVRPAHLPDLLELLARYPDLATVIDHGGKPDIAGRNWQPWADRIAALGEDSGAHCKLSGLLTEARAGDGDEALYPYMDHLYRCFGPHRLMWGSDWPVLNLVDQAKTGAAPKRSEGSPADTSADAQGGAYRRWHAIVQRWLRSKGSAERGAIEGKTAIRFYGLDKEDFRDRTIGG